MKFVTRMEVNVLLIEYKVAYLSKSLNEMQRNYKIYDKEILVAIRRLEN